MKNYKVNIDFKKGASFSADVCAMSEEDAKKDALDFARACSFKEQVKKITVTEEATA